MSANAAIRRVEASTPVIAPANAATPASPLRYCGGLQAHARKIAELLPTHHQYAEPFAGGMSVLLSKPVSEGSSSNGRLGVSRAWHCGAPQPDNPQLSALAGMGHGY